MKSKSERYASADDLGKALGLSDVDLALMHAKKRAITKLVKAREAAGLTQSELAKIIGSKQPSIARMESGIISEVSFDFLVKIAWALGVTLTLRPPESKRAA